MAAGKTTQPLVSPEVPSEAHWGRRSIMANVIKVERLLVEVAELLQHLAAQVRLLFSIKLFKIDAELNWII